jgi:hypothetical protein
VMVGAIYWFVYPRKDGAVPAAAFVSSDDG